jgi:hypothetical protein
MQAMNNEQEWRTLLLGEIKEIKKDLRLIQKEMTTLKVKVAMFSSLIGSAASLLINKLLG